MTIIKLFVVSMLLTGEQVFAVNQLHYDFTKATASDSFGWTTLVRDLPQSIYYEVERRVASNESLGPAGPEVDRFKTNTYPAEHSHWLINFGIFPLPFEIRELGNGFLCQGNNHSDDLDMWIIKKIGKKEGLKVATSYRFEMVVQFASNAQAGGSGVGGSEDALSVGLGATAKDPRELKILPDGEGGVRFADGILQNNFDTGRSIDNGLPYSETDKPYKIVTVKSKAFVVRTDKSGELWLMVGTHSGFESFQAIYYTDIKVSLTPVK